MNAIWIRINELVCLDMRSYAFTLYGYIDSPFLSGNYNTWGESQLRTKVRSHNAGKKFYSSI